MGQDHELASGDLQVDIVGDVAGGDRRALQQLADLGLHGRRRAAERIQQVGLEERRANHMHADLLLRQFNQKAFGQGHHTGLGNVVVAHGRPLHQGGHGGDIDDLALALLQQRQEGLAALDHAHEVDRDLPVPVFKRQLAEEATRGHPGVVDDDIDTAELFIAGLGKGRQLAVVAHVATLGKAITAGLTHQLQGFHQARFGHVRQRQLPAFTRPTQGDFTPQARACTGDHHAILHRGCLVVLGIYPPV
ncbi:hypothetical protein D3C80_1069070 [compost metagenome]